MNTLLLFMIPLTPLAFAVVNMLWGARLPRIAVETFAVCGVATSCAFTLLLWPLSSGEGTRALLAPWLSAGGVQADFALRFDPLAAPLCLMVTAVATLIHLYAVGYMKDEDDPARFFALLNLFVFAMLCIVLADDLLLLFLGWEGVGFCSYALIGFWYRETKNADAGRKAFIVTRIGDLFFGIAILWLLARTGTLAIGAINAQAATLPPSEITAIGLLLLLGACGKSAQLPLMSWLPDAMAGPTPVSALIHAATMVTAGVYLLCRLFPIIALSPLVLAAIAVVGAATALYAASCALAQTEIKRVLAYSTMSQVGYMFLAVGAGSVAAAQFHLIAHAFYKACLFMAAGAIIHLGNGENDLEKLRGVARRNRTVLFALLSGAVCLAGIAPSGGFFSKEAILAAVAGRHDSFHLLLFGSALLTALFTALYSGRLCLYLCRGETPGHAHHPLPRLLLWPLVPLAVAGLGAGLLGSTEGGHGPALAVASTALALGGLALAWRFFARPRYSEDRLATFLRHGWYFDGLFERLFVRPFRYMAELCADGIDRTIIDGTLGLLADACRNWGEKLRRLATGRLSHYLAGFAWGLLVILGWLLLTTVGGVAP